MNKLIDWPNSFSRAQNVNYQIYFTQIYRIDETYM